MTKSIVQSTDGNGSIAVVKPASFPLHDAARNGHRRVVRLLLERGHSLRTLDRDGFRASERARQSGHHVLAAELQERENAAAADPSSVQAKDRLSIKELFGLVQGAPDTVSNLIKVARTNAIDGKGDTALHICAAQGRLQLCDQLIRAGADPSSANLDGKRPHDRAAENGHVVVAELLQGLLPEVPFPKAEAKFFPGSSIKKDVASTSASPPLPPQGDVFHFDDLDFEFDGEEEAKAFHEELDLRNYVSEFEATDGRIASFGDEDGAELELDEIRDGGFRIYADDIIALRPRTAKFADDAIFRSFLDVHTGRRSSVKVTVPTTRYHSIDEDELAEWVKSVLESSRCTLEDVSNLVGCIRGSFEVDSVQGNIVHELKSIGLLILDDEDASRPTEDSFAEEILDADDVVDLLSCICNGSNMRPGMELIPISARTETRLFLEMASSREDICRTLASESMLISVVLLLGEQVEAGTLDPGLVTDLDIQYGRQTPDAEVLSAALSYLAGYQSLLEDDDISAEDSNQALQAILASKLSDTAIQLIAKGIEENPNLDKARRQIEESMTQRAAAFEKILVWHLPHLRRVSSRYGGIGDPEDFFQDGFIGLMRAIERFDLEMGYRLMTYAQFHIRNCVSRACADTGTLVRLPVHIGEKLRKADGALEYLPLNATFEAKAALIDREAGISLQQYDLLELFSGTFEMFDEMNYEHLMPFTDPFDVVLGKQKEKAIQSVFDALDVRKRDILEMRFGFGEYDEHTLEECGSKYDVTRERIRQIEAKAFKKFRHPAQSKLLRDFL